MSVRFFKGWSENNEFPNQKTILLVLYYSNVNHLKIQIWVTKDIQKTKY